MTDKVFFDTNILLYAEFDDGSAKYHTALTLVKDAYLKFDVYMSAQVFNEFFVNALRKDADPFVVQSVLADYSNRVTIAALDFHVIEKCWTIFNRYHFSYWDSLIVAAALESGCSILYSEDLQDGQIIENSLKIVNPFK